MQTALETFIELINYGTGPQKGKGNTVDNTGKNKRLLKSVEL